MSSRCSNCGLPTESGKCCFFSAPEENFKEDLKANYFKAAGEFASAKGLSNFVWRQLLNAKHSENKAWSEKQYAISNIAPSYAKKYDSIISEKNKEIEYQKNLITKLQHMLLNSEPPATNTEKTHTTSGCTICGSKIGCYCK
ncbi:hypothetical protein [Pseudomonas sp. N040]|uniref:hypothetical protein n=1 Tax=Pseudomonas sp. N040 TaxID=2785325 RepID=UPI0018A2B7BA|nr:hypothetical protein [Pseudomonas sp. N040]MBF7728754.1 hypothetical protein [Pseudomonas sp. N040]MBW7012394.1 hypothetical protein [Pseudomonas sp. N040]